MMYKKGFMYMLMPIFLLFIFNINNVFAGGIPQPYRIAGTVTIDGTKLTSSTASGFKITATNLSGAALTDSSSNPAETTTIGSNDTYILDIPIYDSSSQTGGAKTGDTVVLHLYMNGTEYSITAPADGKITVGDSGTNKEVDITAVTPSSAGQVSSSGGGGGCTINPNAGFDPVWILFLLTILAYSGFRKRKQKR